MPIFPKIDKNAINQYKKCPKFNFGHFLEIWGRN